MVYFVKKDILEMVYIFCQQKKMVMSFFPAWKVQTLKFNLVLQRNFLKITWSQLCSDQVTILMYFNI